MTETPEGRARAALRCDECDKPTASHSSPDTDEILCEACMQSIAERAWERHCEDFHDGGSTSWPDAERERQAAARKLK